VTVDEFCDAMLEELDGVPAEDGEARRECLLRWVEQVVEQSARVAQGAAGRHGRMLAAAIRTQAGMDPGSDEMEVA